jgi:predicted enzyme related to lactoylglutathione lyase
MPGPARAGALIYAKNLEQVSSFYQQVLNMVLLMADAEHHVIESPDFQIIIHAIPPHIATTFDIASPPEAREDTAIKLFFTVESLATAAQTAAQLGGQLMESEWIGPGFRVRNALDPEGNVFQLRELIG